MLYSPDINDEGPAGYRMWRLEEGRDRSAGAGGHLFGTADNELCERHDGQRGAEKDDAGRYDAAMIEKSGDGRKDQEPHE